MITTDARAHARVFKGFRAVIFIVSIPSPKGPLLEKQVHVSIQGYEGWNGFLLFLLYLLFFKSFFPIITPYSFFVRAGHIPSSARRQICLCILRRKIKDYNNKCCICNQKAIPQLYCMHSIESYDYVAAAGRVRDPCCCPQNSRLGLVDQSKRGNLFNFK